MMYHFWIVISFFALGVYLSGCQSTSEHAMQYNDSIIEHQARIIKSMDSLESSFEHLRDEEMLQRHEQLNKAIEDAVAYIQTMGDFKGDSSLLQATEDLFGTYREITREDYPVIIDLLTIPDSVFSFQDEQKLYDRQAIIHQKITNAHRDFLTKQQVFGKRHHLVFTTD